VRALQRVGEMLGFVERVIQEKKHWIQEGRWCFVRQRAELVMMKRVQWLTPAGLIMLSVVGIVSQ